MIEVVPRDSHDFDIMHNLQWDVNSFQELSVSQFFEVLQLRVDVFVVEQQCAYPELDEHDRHAETRHLAGHDASSQLMAYARILSAGLRFPEVSLGRFVVRKDARGQGIGHKLLSVALKEIQSSWAGYAIRISAQDYLEKFYGQYGFTRASDVYFEDGSRHIEMLKR